MSIANTAGVSVWANNSSADLKILELRAPFSRSFVMQTHPKLQPSTPAIIVIKFQLSALQ
jgi:hypothetical protein